jgi:hypothetical protein
MEESTQQERLEQAARVWVGRKVTYVDERSVPHDALVTAVHGVTDDGEAAAINLVYVSGDPSQTDPYGRQIARAPSCSRESQHTAHGRFWRP